MTPMYYYMWEFFTSITIIILVIAYIVWDRVQTRKEKEQHPDSNTKNAKTDPKYNMP